MSELKCCPFCGGEAILDREDIFCDYCHLSMRIYARLHNGEAETYEEAKHQAIENWNERKPMANIVENIVTSLESEKTVFLGTRTEQTDTILIDDAINIVKQEINNGLE